MSKKITLYSLVILFLVQPWNQEVKAINDKNHPYLSVNQQEYALGFDAVLERTIDYLQGLQIKLISFAQEAHEKDAIMADICVNLPGLFDRNEINAYALKSYLSKSLEKQALKIFNGKKKIPLVIFCQSLAGKCQELILEFKKTDLRILRKKYSANIARYKISQYPSTKLVLLTIYALTRKYVPPPPPAITDEELNLWQIQFQEKLDLFKTKNATQLFRKDALIKWLGKFQKYSMEKDTPYIREIYLIKPIITQLGDQKIWAVSTVIEWIEKEVPNLAIELKKRSLESSFNKYNYSILSNSTIDSYLNMLKHGLVEDNFADYETTIKEWETNMHQYLVDEIQNTKDAVYDKRTLLLYLPKKIQAKDNLLNLNEVAISIQETLKAKGATLTGEEIHQLLLDHFNPKLYDNLRTHYKKIVETTEDDFTLGRIVESLDLPRISQIKYAILTAKK